MKHFKKSHSKDSLLPGYEDYLCIGIYLDADEQFDDMDHAKRVWVKHRDKIMKQYQQGGAEYHPRSPGDRPWGYIKFDLNIEPTGGYYDQVPILIEMGEITPEEIEMIRKDPLVARLIAKDDPKLQRLFGIEKVITLNQKRREKAEIDENDEN